MSTTLNTQIVHESDQNIHFVPADIQYDGKANVSSYFDTTMRSDTEQILASLRGRPLNGKIFEVPTGYTGVIVTETRKPFTDEEERNLTANQTFKSFHYWNLDQKPTDDDKLAQAMNWIEIAKAVHQPVSESDSQGSLKSEVSM